MYGFWRGLGHLFTMATEGNSILSILDAVPCIAFGETQVNGQ